MENFEKVVQLLSDAKIKCRVRLVDDNSITVELGSNYPDELASRVWDILGDIEVDICASVSANFLKTKNIEGGIPEYPYLREVWNFAL